MGRTIATKLVIEGESEYRRALSRINAEHGTLKADLSGVKAAYAGNANSAKALEAQLAILEKTQGVVAEKVSTAKSAFEAAKAAQAQYAQKVEECRSKLEAAQKALYEFQTTGNGTADKERKLAEAVATYSKELEDAEKVNEKAQNAVFSYSKKLDSAKKEQERLGKSVKDTKKYIDEAKKSTDGHATSIDGYGKKTTEAQRKTADMNKAISALAQTLSAKGIKIGLEEIVELLEACINASVKFESAMAGVKRTVGGSDEEIDAMGKAFQELSVKIPITAIDLAKIAETAGQLGVARDQVEEFTRIMAMLGTTTDLTAENAATLLAQFANITGLKDYERLGSVVAELGDATATTATKVVEMSQGLAAAGSQAGMRETEIMAISAAVGSLGIEAQAGSTAMSTLIASISKSVETGGDKLARFAAIAGKDATSFAKAWKSDAAGAFTSFIEGLNKNEKSAIVLLNELGITNVRQTKAILGLAEAGDLLSRTIDQANQAWEDNTALSDKASVMYETTEAKMTMLKNSVESVKVAIGDQLTPALGDVAELGTDAFQWAEQLIEDHPWIANALAGIAAALITLAAAGLGAFIIATISATTAWNAFTAALLANPVGIVLVALAAATAGLLTFISSLQSAQDEEEETGETTEELADNMTPLADGLEDVGDAAEEAAGKLFDLGEAMKDTKDAYKLLAKAQEEYTADGYLSLDMVERLMNAGLTEYLEEVEGGYRLTEGALESYLETQRADYQLTYDNAEKAAKAVLNTETLKANGYDTTTMSIREQLAAMRELYAMKAGEARTAALEKYGNDAIGRKMASEDPILKSLDGLVMQAENAIQRVDAAKKSLDSFDRMAATLGRDYGSAGNSKTSKSTKSEKEKTPAELALEEWNERVAELDHLRAMDLLAEEDYYKQKDALARELLTANKSEREKWEEELYSYQKGTYARELAALGYLRDMDLISTEDYWLKYIELQKNYLKESSDEWRDASKAVYDYLKEQHEDQLEAIEDGYDEELKAQEAAYKERQAAAKERNKVELEDLKEHFKERQEVIKAGYAADKEAAKAAYEEKKALIEDEMAQEQKKLNAKIDAIDAELTARKRLREDESEDDEIAKARKRLQAAQTQRSYARTEEDKHQWDLEVVRLQEALSAAIRDKEDTAFEREKADEKAAIQEQLTVVKESGNQAKEEAKAAYESTMARMEADYNASLERVQANYDSDMDMAEKRYEQDLQRLEANYNAAVARLREETKTAAVAWAASNPEAVYQKAVTTAGGLGSLDLGALAGMLNQAVTSTAGAVSMVEGASSTNTRNSFALNNYGGTLSEGHAMNLFMKLLEKISR